MSVKKNFVFNSILTISQYIFPLITFPYISRIFGVERIGLLNFADSVVNYYIMFSTLGLSLTGIREVARCKNDRNKLNKAFSELLVIHVISTLIFLIVYLAMVLTVPRFHENNELFYIGISKLLFSVFLIEWLYRGIENFKFITTRSIIIKILYVLSIFVFVRKREDYLIYFILTCSVTVINSFVNIYYTRNIVSFTLKNLELKRHLKSYFTIGIYMILTSLYMTFDVIFLGMYTNNTAVGYYTTAMKLYAIILGFFSALNAVLMPRLASLIAEKDTESFKIIIQKSIIFVSTFCFPIIMGGIVLAPSIIFLLSGRGFEGAIICFRIILPLIFVVGIAQILANQVLMSIKKDNELLKASAIGGIVSVILNFVFIPKYHEIGTSIVIIISESVVMITLLYSSLRYAKISLPLKPLFKNFMLSIPYLLICYVCTILYTNQFLIVGLSVSIGLIYFIISQLYIVKNEMIVSQFYLYLNKIKVKFDKF